MTKRLLSLCRMPQLVLGLLLISGMLSSALADREAVERGLAAYKSQNWAQAQANFQEALKTDPENPQIHYNLGATFFKQDNYEQSLESLKKALVTDDIELQQHTYYNIGNVQAKMEKYKESIDAYKKALELNPDDVDAKYNLELIRAKLKEKSDKEQQQDKNKDEEKVKPSEYAKQLKAQAENLVTMRMYPQAHDLMSKGLEKDQTVSAYQQFIDRIKTVVDIGNPL
ncbi:MAG: tetratricopeptide repeat protein [Calditrichia bacterium]